MIAELARVADAGDQDRGDDRADAQQGRKPAAGLARPAEPDDAVVERSDPGLQPTQLVQQAPEQLGRQCCQLRGWIIKNRDDA